MANESGRKIAVGIGKETTRGTAVAPSYWPKHLELDFIQKAEKQLNESGLQVLDKFNSAEVMKDWGEGKIAGKVTDRSIGLILAAFFGAAPTTSDNADTDPTVKDHTYAQSQSNEPLTLSIAVKDQNRDERYPMAMLKSLELSAEVGDWLKFSADFLSKKPAVASNTVAYVAENEFKAKHITVKLASTVGGLGAAQAIPLRNFKLMGNKNVNPYFAFGSNDPNNIFAHELELSGDMTLLYDGNTHRDAFLNNTNQVMQITIQNSDVTIGAAANPKLVITLYKVNLSDWGLDQGLGNMVEQTLGFQGLYSLSDAKSIDAVLTNVVASY